MSNQTEAVQLECRHCGQAVHFNAAIRKWVTSQDNWKCGSDPKFPVRAHNPFTWEV